MVNLRTTLETRFGIPLAELMQRFADIDFSRSDTAAVLNVSYQALLKLLQRHGDPFPAYSLGVRYRQETGGSLLASACYLAQSRSLAGTARELGVSENGFRQYLQARGMKLTFHRRERQEWRQHRVTGQPRRTSPTWQTYEAFGVKGSLRKLTERFGVVGLPTVRSRVNRDGWTVEKALTLPREDGRRRGQEALAEVTRAWMQK